MFQFLETLLALHADSFTLVAPEEEGTIEPRCPAYRGHIIL